MCIDEELVCDKYSHCPYDNDEDQKLCAHYGETEMTYDKLTISIVFGLFLATIMSFIFIFAIICLFRNTNLSSAFYSIFGNKNESKEKTIIILEENEAFYQNA